MKSLFCFTLVSFLLVFYDAGATLVDFGGLSVSTFFTNLPFAARSYALLEPRRLRDSRQVSKPLLRLLI